MKIRPNIFVPGTPVAAVLVPHKTDPTKLAIKSPIPEGGVVLAALAGVEPEGEVVRGRNFFIAIVDKAACNEVIRRIYLVADSVEPEGGVAVAVQELLYSGGSMDF